MIDSLSIYIHWPFCLSKCPYCDFNSHVVNNIDYSGWLKAYESEIEYFAELIENRYIKSIFFGGGTPSLMTASLVEGILKKITSIAQVNKDTEITIEANPTSVETDKFKEFRSAGINRVSIGVQALNNSDLKALGRQHNEAQGRKAVELATGIFPRVSFDLIYARSNQKLKEWQEELTEAIQLASGHISLYQLTIEKGTLFHKMARDGGLRLPDNDLAADMYEWTTEYLAAKNYHRYEISNYAMPKEECRHNLNYWHYQSYLGIGPGAHSRLALKSNSSFLKRFEARTRNGEDLRLASGYNKGIYSIMMHHRPDKWLKAVEADCGIQLLNRLGRLNALAEFFMMGLRLPEGISREQLQNFLQRSASLEEGCSSEQVSQTEITDIINSQEAERYARLGLVNYSNANIRLTNKGLMLHSYLVPRLL